MRLFLIFFSFLIIFIFVVDKSSAASVRLSHNKNEVSKIKKSFFFKWFQKKSGIKKEDDSGNIFGPPP